MLPGKAIGREGVFFLDPATGQVEGWSVNVWFRNVADWDRKDVTGGMAEGYDRVPADLLAWMQEPRLVQVTTLDAGGAPFVNVISWVLVCTPEVIRLAGDLRTRFMQNLQVSAQVALTVYGAGTAWTVYGKARVISRELPGLPPTFAVAEVTGLRVHAVMSPSMREAGAAAARPGQ